MSSVAAESDQLLDAVRRATVSYEEQLYTLRKASYQVEQAEDIRRHQADLKQCTAWALARNEAARRLRQDLINGPSYSDVEDYKEIEPADDELFSSDS